MVLAVVSVPVVILCWKVIPVELKLKLDLNYRSADEKIQTVIAGLFAYAADWDAAFPKQLDELTPHYISEETLVIFDPVTQSQVQFEYAPGLHAISGSRTPLLWSPASYRKMKLVGFVSGEVRTITDAEFDWFEAGDFGPLLDTEHGGMLSRE